MDNTLQYLIMSFPNHHEEGDDKPMLRKHVYRKADEHACPVYGRAATGYTTTDELMFQIFRDNFINLLNNNDDQRLTTSSRLLRLWYSAE